MPTIEVPSGPLILPPLVTLTKPPTETDVVVRMAAPVTSSAEDPVALAARPHWFRLTTAPLLSETPVVLLLSNSRRQSGALLGSATARARTVTVPEYTTFASTRVCGWAISTSTASVAVV